MRKNLNKLATLALSGMMVMSMAVPALAAKTELPLYKVLYTDGETYAPNTTFNFSVTESSVQTYSGQTLQKLASQDKVNEAITIKGVPFTKADGLGEKLSDADKLNGHFFSKETKIAIDADKLNLGYYLFDLNEVDGGYPGITYDNTTYKLFVTVTEENGVKKATGVVIKEGANGKVTKPNSIGNNYGREVPVPNPDPNPNPNPNPDPKYPPVNPDDSTHDVTIKKNVDTNLLTAQEKKDTAFNIKVTIISDNPAVDPATNKKVGERFKVTGEGLNPAVENFIDSEEDNAKTFALKHGGDGIRISGLTKGDIVKVEETNGATYTMTVKPENKSYFDAAMEENNADLFKVTDSYKTEFKVIKDEAKTTINNKKDAITPTGIVMNVAPYAMMLAVAGGLGVVFMNRKKEEE